MIICPKTPLIRLALTLCVLLVIGGRFAWSATFYYSYGEDTGSVSVLEVDDETGKVEKHESLAEAVSLPSPKKVAVSEDGKNLAITSDKGPKVAIVQVKPEVQLLATFDVDEATTDVKAWNSSAVLAAENGAFYEVDLKTGKVDQTWNSRQSLTPSGHKGEEILPLPGKDLAFVTFQKDSKKGKHFGSRLVVMDLKTLSPKFDLPLPRNHPELHINGNLKEQGPNPEVVLIAPKSDTIVVTLDLYGAIAFAKLSSALTGKLSKLEYVSSAMDGSLGGAFPDRASLFEVGGKEYLLVSNASPDGGLALFDVPGRKVIQKFPAGSGCETPVFLPASHRLVTCVSGKSKTRDGDKISETQTPENDLLVFDVAPLKQGQEAKLERIAFDQPVISVQAVNPEKNDLLVLVLGGAENEIAIYDLASRKVVHREPASGKVSRMAAWNRKSATGKLTANTP